MLPLLEEIVYPLVYAAVNLIVFQRVHELVMGHSIECLTEVEDRASPHVYGQTVTLDLGGGGGG